MVFPLLLEESFPPPRSDATWRPPQRHWCIFSTRDEPGPFTDFLQEQTLGPSSLRSTLFVKTSGSLWEAFAVETARVFRAGLGTGSFEVRVSFFFSLL